ncbi:hypothetical protein D3C76_1011120 [compost metagenome]
MVATADGGYQVLGHVIEVFALDFLDGLGVEVFAPLQALPAKLHVGCLVSGVDELIGMHAIAIHVPIAFWRAFVGIEQGQGPGRFGHVREQVEAAGIIAEVVAGVGFEGMDHVRELDRIADEEGREIVADQVPVAGAGVEACSEAAWVTQGFR